MSNINPQQLDDQFGDMLYKAKESGNYSPTLPEGNHVVALYDFSRRNSRNQGSFFSARFAVVKSTNPECKPGSIYGDAYFVEKGDYAESNMARARNFIRAVCSLPDNCTGDQFKTGLASMLDKRNLARGVQIKAIGVPKMSKKNTEYVACSYDALPQTDEQIADMRTWLEGVEGDDPDQGTSGGDSSFDIAAIEQAPAPTPAPVEVAPAAPAARPFFSRG